MADYIPLLILLLLVGTAFIVARTNNLFSVAFLAGILSLLAASLYMILDAPDVAFTEAAVGAGISTIFFLITISVVEERRIYTAAMKIPALVLSLIVGVLIYYSMLDLPKLSDSDLALHAYVARYYIEHSMSDIGIPNVVTSVLASYRGLDTLGEVAVIFTAGIGVLIILGRHIAKGKENDH
ncbi:MAG: DUF4040 domain-containing protein [Gammaproteobacteria bacterium]|nr:DUF4040 domain-containing protein [Gammaproteobacteria bacterium]